MRTTKAHDTTRDTYQSKTYTMYTCMLLSHKKKVDFYTNWKPQKCNWSWYLNKIIMKTYIISETSTVKNTKKKKPT